jgi:chaperonin GroES
MNYRPLGDRVVLEREEDNAKTASGIIIPDSATEKQNAGTVVAVGESVEKKGEIKVGDEVVLGKYTGTEITLDGKEYVVVNSAEILLKKV